jgi:addiction module RelE/StbE family toxin
MYVLVFTKTFDQSYKSIVKYNKELEKRTLKTLKLLQENPFYPSLKAHKVNTKNYGHKWSCWITGDMRIIWDFDENNKVRILLLTIGSHSGKHKEYK